MKVGVITIQKCDNFGADLQAYALQRKLQLMGYDAENIDYLFYKHPRHQGGRGGEDIPLVQVRLPHDARLLGEEARLVLLAASAVEGNEWLVEIGRGWRTSHLISARQTCYN